jgi:drug/metabolite transporter (DMT)-like permease
MTIGTLGYVVNDAFVRKMTEPGPGIYQVLCMRSVCLAVLLAAVARMRGESTKRDHLQGPLLVRVAAEVVASALFFAGILRLDFANAQAILLIVPFAITLAAAWLLDERVSIRQYVAIVVGFVGVVMVVRPATDEFSVWALVVLASAGFLVLREFATRGVAPETPALSIAFVTAIGLAFLTGVLSMFDDGWVAYDATGWLYLALSSCALFVGYLFSIQTVRIGDLSVSAPFRYTGLVGAVVIGYFAFDETPDLLTVAGSAVIIATGLYAVYLERVS